MKHTYKQMMLHENDSGFLFNSLFLYFACLHDFLLIFGEGRGWVERQILGGWHEMDNMDYTNLSFKSFGKNIYNLITHLYTSEKKIINGIGYTLYVGIFHSYFNY